MARTKSRKSYRSRNPKVLSDKKANAYGKFLYEEVREEYEDLNYEVIVHASHSKSAPTREWFVWDNDKAGHLYRLEQARSLVSLIVIERLPSGYEVEGELPAGVLLVDKSKPGGSKRPQELVPIEEVINSKDKTDQLMKKALQELKSFRRKYQWLKALLPLWKAIDEIEVGL